MKQSEDEKSIALDDGRVFKAVITEPSRISCTFCAFKTFPFEIYCENIFCNGFEREDRQDVYFVEVKNENQ